MSNIYKNLMKIIAVLAAAAAASCLTSCESRYNELPPKTDASVQYAIPSPEQPSQEELEAFKALRDEHRHGTE